jgi:hypothetical protein
MALTTKFLLEQIERAKRLAAALSGGSGKAPDIVPIGWVASAPL